MKRSFFRMRVVGILAGAVLMLALGSAAVLAAPGLQQAATPTPVSPPAGGGSAPDLEALAEAAEEENLEWENITFWSQGTLGDPELARLEIAFEIGDPVPAFEMPTLHGDVFDLAQASGPLLLNFWASWCGPCQLELPYLLDLHDDPGAPFGVVMINVWETESDYLSFARSELPESVLSGRAPEGLPEQYGVQAIPVSILLDDRHRAVAVHVGNLTPAPVALLRALAGDTTPAVAAVQALATPTPIPTILPPPAESGGGEPQPIAQLAEAAATANRREGGSTLWREGSLGPDDGSRLGVEIGDKLPGFGLMTAQGEAFRLDLAGGPVLLNFWASWCGPCIVEFPLLVSRHQDPANPYRVAFVNIWDDPYTQRIFLQDYPADLLIMTDTRAETPETYGIEFIPVSILVDAAGVVQMIQLGPVNEAVLNLAAALVRES